MPTFAANQVPTQVIQIDQTIVSLDVFEKEFCCDLNRCKGICCVEGESGAPLEKDEIAQLEAVLPHVWEWLSDKAKQVIRKQGASYQDQDGDDVTSIVDGKDCVFTCYDEQGICYCAIEKAWREGKTSFMKPISCHLYPIRLQTLHTGDIALNYHKWPVCSSACQHGHDRHLPLYRFLKEPLIRRFGEEWYEKLCLAAKWWEEESCKK